MEKDARFTIRMQPELKETLFKMAESKGLSTSALATLYISNGLKQEGEQKDMLNALKKALEKPETVQALGEMLQQKLL